MIVLLPYDPAWQVQFASAREEILSACNGLILEVHHVGSTAIPCIAAKPVIDLMPVVRRFEDGAASVAALQALGYQSRGEHGIAGRHYFVRGTPRTHQAHLFAAGHPEIERHLLFRDYLCAHAYERAAYERLKRKLAAEFGDDRQAYAAAKTPFCDRIDRLARAERQRR
ncbi:MAG TPA: GrpB family protein [Dongiaceae bacterium]|nr:GrpB family protein [Dongiaceae bacterium]